MANWFSIQAPRQFNERKEVFGFFFFNKRCWGELDTHMQKQKQKPQTNKKLRSLSTTTYKKLTQNGLEI